jgi:alginate O-acetyltransferase complex protein AlgJ
LRNIVFDQLEVDRSPELDDFGRGQMRGIPGRGELKIQGWVIGSRSIPVRVELKDQAGKKITTLAVDQPRPDIAEAFPDVPGAATSGFEVTLRPEGSGAARIDVLVAFEDESATTMAVLSCEVCGDGAGSEEPSWQVVTLDEKVLIGKQGWLYLHGDTNNIIGQHTGLVKMGDQRREGWRRVLEGRVAVSDDLGIPWHCLVVPDKESVYPEYLPDDVVPVARRPVHDFLELAEAVGVPVSYGLDRLLAVKGDREVYSRTDSHWNSRGAYEAYRMFCEALAAKGLDLDVVEETDLEWFEAMVEGGLGDKVRPEPITGPTTWVRIKQPQGRVVFDNEVQNHGRVVCCERDRPGPTCVLFGESFSDYLLPFLRETFQRLVFVHTSMFVAEVLEREQPDAVLSLPTERFLIRVPDDAGALAQLRALAVRKGGELPWPALS